MTIAPLVGTEHLAVQTVVAGAVADTTSNARALATLGQAIPAHVNTQLATSVGDVISAAALIGAVVTRTGTAADFTDTCDTAAAIIAALPGETPLNFRWEIYIRNTTAFFETIAQGTGIALVGNKIIPPNSTGVFKALYTGPGAITLIGVAVVANDPGPGPVVDTPITTVGAGTLTAAAIVGGIITRTGSTAAFSDATDTAANIIAALPNSGVGETWWLTINNETAFAETLTNGSGVTLSGLAGPIPGNSSAMALCTYTSAGAVGIDIVAIHYNAASGADPSSKQTFFGGGTGTFKAMGALYTEFDSAGVHPATTGNNNVLSVFTIAAATLDLAGRGVNTKAKGHFAANGDTKEVTIVVNPSAAVVGSAVVGGTIVADSGAVTTSGGGWEIEADFFKYGALGSNTQMATGKFTGAASALTAAQAITATESGAILVAICSTATTTNTDIVLSQVVARAMD